MKSITSVFRAWFQVWVVPVSVFMLLVAAAALIQGCGGSASGPTPSGPALADPVSMTPATNNGPVPVAAAQTAAVTLTVVWPTRPSTAADRVTPRLIPIDSNTIQVQVLQRNAVIDQQLAIRPATGNVSVIFFSSLPADQLVVKATAYPGIHAATGVAQAAGQTVITTHPGSRTDVRLTLVSTITGFTITPAHPIVIVGKAILVTASAHNAQGQIVPTVANTLRWSTRDTTIAKINPNSNPAGYAALEGIKVGVTTVTITDLESHKTGTATVTVVLPQARVDITPASPTVAVRHGISLTATARDASGNALTVPSANFKWTVSNTAIATVTATGNPVTLTGVQAGTTQVTVTETGSGLHTAVPVVVTAPQPTPTPRPTPTPVPLPTPTPNPTPTPGGGVCVPNFGQSCSGCVPNAGPTDCTIGCQGTCDFTAPH